MNKIAKEMYESCLRDLIWQVAEDLGPAEATILISELIREYSQELAAIVNEQGVIVTKPERSLAG